MRLPSPRGVLSNEVVSLLRSGATHGHDTTAFGSAVAAVSDPLSSGDFQLALACCYELHYRGFDDVSEELEWDPPLIALRRQLEGRFEASLVDLVPVPRACSGAPLPALRALVEAEDDTTLSRFLLRTASLEHMRDFVIQRSIYQLKEGDPHTWQVPRLSGRTKEALVEIQADEYGGGRPGRSHAEMFRRTMRSLDLDDTYGAYWDAALPETFAAVNLMSLLGLQRRHRGAALGHLAALEMTSTAPNRRYADGLRRLGLGSAATAYFDEHVEADAVHEQIAAVDMCGGFVRSEPERCADVLWGAALCLALDRAASVAILQRWKVPWHQGAA
jgi:hypothetical protein